jgi:hypothetical protein
MIDIDKRMSWGRVELIMVEDFNEHRQEIILK